MVRHPYEYAAMLKERMLKHNANVWLVNTGWVGGRFGVGKRISIRHTRNLLNAALEGKLEKFYKENPSFQGCLPRSINITICRWRISEQILNFKNTH